MNCVLVLIFVVAVVHCNPTEKERFHPSNHAQLHDIDDDIKDAEVKLEDIKDDIKDAVILAGKLKDTNNAELLAAREDKLQERLTLLTQRVRDINGALKKSEDEKTKKTNEELSSLEDSLKEAVAEDEAKEKDALRDEQKYVSAKNKVKFYTAKDVFGADIDDSDSDFPEYDDLLKDSKKDASQSKVEAGMHADRPISKPKKDSAKAKTEVEVNDELEKERKRQINEVKDQVIGIKHDLKKIQKNFKDMKKLYIGSMNDRPLDESAQSKFEEIKGDLNNIMVDFKDIKSQFPARKNNEMQDESVDDHLLDETKAILSDMKDQLQSTSDAIQELVKISTTENEQKVPNDEDDLAELNTLKDGVQDVIHRMIDVRGRIKQRDSKATQKRSEDVKKEDEIDIKDSIAGIRRDFESIKELVGDMAKRHT